MKNQVNNKAITELREHIANGIQDLRGSNLNVCDLHHELFNTNYYVIGYHQAELKILEWGLSSFQALNLVRDYELENFGEISEREINAENTCNMIAYILGEEILNDSQTIQDYSNCTLDDYETLEELDGLTLDQYLINEFTEN